MQVLYSIKKQKTDYLSSETMHFVKGKEPNFNTVDPFVCAHHHHNLSYWLENFLIDLHIHVNNFSSESFLKDKDHNDWSWHYQCVVFSLFSIF